MILLKVLSGSQAGAEVATRRFPVRVGRQVNAHLRLTDAGVWDDHLQIDLKKHEGFSVRARPEAMTLINDEVVSGPQLVRNGDILTAGSARLQFWLGAPRQRSRRIQEFVIWGIITGVSLAQVALIYWLLSLTG